MDRMIARRLTDLDVAAGQDRVVLGISLPSDTVVHDVRARIRFHSDAKASSQTSFAMGCEAYILPVFDPDSAANYDTLWDQLVPKDTDVQTMDLDTGTTDTTPFFEPGEADWTSLFDVGLRPERLYRRTRVLNIVDGGLWQGIDTETPFGLQWIPGGVVPIHIRRKLRVRQPSVLVIGFASPNFDDTTSAAQAILLEAEWPQVKYIGHVLERALLHVLGLVEAGAETPWEEATALLQKHLDPDPLEETGARFGSLTWHLMAEMTIDHSVPGELGKKTISLGRG